VQNHKMESILLRSDYDTPSQAIVLMTVLILTLYSFNILIFHISWVYKFRLSALFTALLCT